MLPHHWKQLIQDTPTNMRGLFIVYIYVCSNPELFLHSKDRLAKTTQRPHALTRATIFTVHRRHTAQARRFENRTFIHTFSMFILVQ